MRENNSFVMELVDNRYYAIEEMTYSYRSDRKYYSACGKDGNRVFIKYQLEKNDNLHKLIKEKKILEALGEKTYELEKHDEQDYIITDFLTGYSTLRALYEHRVDSQVIAQYTILAFEEWIEYLNRLLPADMDIETENHIRRFRATGLKLLISSGWNQVNGPQKVIWEYAGGVLVYLVSLLFQFGIIKTDEVGFISHGDFHWGNVMCGNGKAKIVDIENVMRGDPNMDMAFFMVRLQHYFKTDILLTAAMEEGFKKFKKSIYYNERNYKAWFTLFRFFSKINPRFR